MRDDTGQPWRDVEEPEAHLERAREARRRVARLLGLEEPEEEEAAARPTLH
jgi:hypothetical protein